MAPPPFRDRSRALSTQKKLEQVYVNVIWMFNAFQMLHPARASAPRSFTRLTDHFGQLEQERERLRKQKEKKLASAGMLSKTDAPIGEQSVGRRRIKVVGS